MLLAAATAATSGSPTNTALFVAGASFAWAGLVVTAGALSPRESLSLAIACACVVGIALVLAPPLLSDDVYRYLWDGRVTLSGTSPYRYAPDDPHLAPLRDALWRRVNNADIPTIYPPAAQLLFAACDAIAHTPLPVKALMLAAHLVTVPLVGRLAGAAAESAAASASETASASASASASAAESAAASASASETASETATASASASETASARASASETASARASASETASARASARATLVFALCPLALAESALSGHVDAVAGLAIAAGLLALVRSRVVVAALFLALASATKLVGLLLAPLVAVRDRRAALLAIVLALLPLLALAGGRESTGGLGHYARRWRGNEGAFVVVEYVAARGVDGVASFTNSSPTHIRFPALRGAIEALRGTPIDPRAGLVGPKKFVHDVSDFQRVYVAGLVARGLVLALLLGLVAWLVRRRVEPLRAARLVLLIALLFAPQLHPWYLLWLLPLECASGGVAGLVWAASALTAYAPADRWLSERVWAEPSGARLLVHGLVWLVLAAEGLAILRARPRKVSVAAS